MRRGSISGVFNPLNAQTQPPPPQNIKISSEADSVPTTGSTRPFDDDGYLGYDPRLSSQRFDSFVDSESLKDSATDSPIFHGSAVDDAFATQPASEAVSLPSIYAESNGQGFDGGFGGSDHPLFVRSPRRSPTLLQTALHGQHKSKAFTKPVVCRLPPEIGPEAGLCLPRSDRFLFNGGALSLHLSIFVP